ncbi:MAG: LysM peptidoglycan-binding domain-containing protein [Aquificales bacterium]|nr:LysM peptidoglycan-binding domain-containing protein [Aquificales bacterium]
MISQQRLFQSLIIVLLLSIFLVGCVRSAPEGEGAGTDTSAPLSTSVPSEPDTSDPNVGGGTSLDPTAVPDTDAPAYPADTIAEPEAIAESYPATEENAVDATTADESEQTVAETEETVVVPVPAEGDTAEETAVSAETTTSSTDCPKEHVVQPGENLFRIGLQYGLSWVTLAQYNGITNPNGITAGQTIKVPCDGTPPPGQPTPPPDDVTTYVVQPGDNLFRIGLKFGVSWVEIAEANGLVNPNQIYTGQVLKIPTSAPGPRPEFTHVVKQGETIYSISVQYGVSAAAIAEANNLQEPYVIYAGQTLIIPGNG